MTKIYSIEKQITLRATIASILIFLAASLSLDVVIVGWLEQEYDSNLASKGRVIATLIKDLDEGLEFDFADEIMPEFERRVDPEYLQIWQQGSGVIERSHSIEGKGDLQASSDWQEGSHFHNVELIDGRMGRQIEMVFTPQIVDKRRRTTAILSQQKKVRLIIAKERESLSNLITLIHGVLLLGCLFIGTIVALQMAIITKRSLSPLHKLRDQIRALDPQRVNQRIDIGHAPQELTLVVGQFNEALAKIEDSVYREQRFTQDVAHELRTPISELKSMAEVAMRWPVEGSDLRQFNQDIYDIALQMQATTNNLLALARSDKGMVALEPSEQNIFLLVKKIVTRVIHLAGKKNIDVNYSIDSEQTLVATSKVELELVLVNIIDNAVEYSPPGSVFNVILQSTGGVCSLTVTNTSCNLQQEDLNLMFERLWRKDTARSASSHSGLGMALVKSYAQLLGLNVDVSLDAGAGAGAGAGVGLFSLRLSGFRVV